jgi:hypothetical protein
LRLHTQRRRAANQRAQFAANHLFANRGKHQPIRQPSQNPSPARDLPSCRRTHAPLALVYTFKRKSARLPKLLVDGFAHAFEKRGNIQEIIRRRQPHLGGNLPQIRIQESACCRAAGRSAS